MGFPIRKSADQSFFAAPRGLSQRSTSFIASQRQGIHRMPLRHLIALILDTHPEMTPERGSLEKDQLAFKIDPKACGQARQQGVSHRLRLAPETMFRIDLLFTMSDNTRSSRQSCRATNAELMFWTSRRNPAGGARRDRTDDLLLAKQALSQLSYGPSGGQRTDDGRQKRSVVCRLTSVV